MNYKMNKGCFFLSTKRSTPRGTPFGREGLCPNVLYPKWCTYFLAIGVRSLCTQRLMLRIMQFSVFCLYTKKFRLCHHLRSYQLENSGTHQTSIDKLIRAAAVMNWGTFREGAGGVSLGQILLPFLPVIISSPCHSFFAPVLLPPRQILVRREGRTFWSKKPSLNP